MEEELPMINKNDTWELVDRPDQKNVIGVKWVYRTKFNLDGSIFKHKARLVVKGYSQQPGVDFGDTFAPIARHETEDICVEQPEGFIVAGEEDKVYKLKKDLYGLKQAPRAWYSRLDTHLLSQGFNQSLNEPTLYFKRQANGKRDEVLPGNGDFSILRNFLVPKKLMKDDGEEHADSKLYRSLIGSLLYLTATRPNVMFVSNLLSRYMQCPSTKHFGAAKRVLRYIRGTTDYGIWYKSVENGALIGYSDSDWGGCFDATKAHLPLAIARRSLDEWPRAGSDDIGERSLPFTPSGRVAKDKDVLKQNGITNVLNCVGFVCPEYFKCDFVYRTLWLQDSPSEDITSILYDVFDYFEEVREQHGRVFVHCCQGVSRSTSLVIAYLMWREGQSFDDAFEYVKAAIYVWIGKKCEAIMERDARGAVCQIVRYEKVQGPIITVMEGEEPLYFWDALSNFLPLMDKLKNGGDVVESSSKVCPGERKVDTYNVDFEIFQKATSGGVVPPFSSCDAEHETHLPLHSSCMLSLSSSCSSSPSTISLSSKSSSSSSSSSSASSPPYPSPDSILSDSSVNSKCLSDSPAVSLSVICADLTSSTPSNSSVSVLPPKISPQSISKTSKYIDVNFTSQNSSQSAPALSKKFPLPIAERRGSLSKCHKLPMLTDDFERKGGHLKSVANEQGNIGILEVTNESFNEAATAGEILQSPQEIIESKVDELHRSLDILGMDNPSDKEATVFGGFHESWEKKPCNESSSAVLNGVVDTSGASCNLVKPVVYRWPSLEILATCSIDDLDSKGAYIFIIPTSGLGKDASRAVYVWVGRSFSCDFSKVRQVDCKGPGDPGEIDWKQAASDVLHQMVLPIDSNIKSFGIFCCCWHRRVLPSGSMKLVSTLRSQVQFPTETSTRRLLLEVVRGGSPE
ncbi:hypothetical protein BC332_14245 [Capsicum chinense]|nr:hypothetical protein BC332_14245 [Capsicum chinense]